MENNLFYIIFSEIFLLKLFEIIVNSEKTKNFYSGYKTLNIRKRDNKTYKKERKNEMTISYKDSGVDKEEEYKTV